MRRLVRWWRLRGTETWVQRRVQLWLSDPRAHLFYVRVR